MPFRALGLGPRILKAIQESGYTEPTPIQIKAIPFILKGRDVIGTAQTGTGKTAAYVWPLIERLAAEPRAAAGAPAAPGARGAGHPSTTAGARGAVHAPAAHGVRAAAHAPPPARAIRVLVLVPTRELAVQVEESVRTYAKHLPLQCAAVYGGVGEAPQIKALRARFDIIAATPGRLLDLMSRMPGVFRDLHTLILDEADRMLDMGFLPDIRRIIRELPRERQTLLFSATFSNEIEKVSREFLHNPEPVEVGPRATPTHLVTQFVYEVSRSRKTSLLVHLLKDAGLNTVLVFTRTKRGADKVARKLEQEGVNVATLHSNRSQSQRQVALKGFKSGRYRVLVATDIAARGIDVDGISHVVNFDFPAQSEDYVHRIGRTGRALAIGDALSFVTPDDHAALRALEKFIGRGIPRRAVDAAVERMPVEEPARREGHGARSGSTRREGGAVYRQDRPARGRGEEPRGRQSERPAGAVGSRQGERREGGQPRSGGGGRRPERPEGARGETRRPGARSETRRPDARADVRRGEGRRPDARRPAAESRRETPAKPVSAWGRLVRRVVGKPGKKKK